MRSWLLALLVIGLTSCRQPAPSVVPGEPVMTVKMTVSTDGIYEVPFSALRAVGFDTTATEAKAFALSTGGQEVDFELSGRGDRQALRFYGQSLGTPAYTAQNIYWLSWRDDANNPGDKSQAILARSSSPPQGVTLTEVVSTTVRAEEQRLFIPKVGPGEDRWLWMSLFAPGEIKVSIAALHAVDGEAELSVHVWGNSDAPVTPNHHLELTLNGTEVAGDVWGGTGGHTISATVPSGVLRAGDNELLLRAPGDTGAPADSVLLDWVEISYPRQLVADDGRLTFEGSALGYTLRPGDTVAALWDVTEPTRPVALRDSRSQDGAVSLAGQQAGGDTSRRYALATAAGLRHPDAIAAATSVDLRDWPGGADLIIVTVPQLRKALQPLIEAREASGLRVATIDVAAVYDNFSQGRTDPGAIRELVRYAREHWQSPAPRFLLLAGDASYDPRGYVKGSEVDLVPTKLVNTAFSGWTASDVWFALPDDSPDAQPALAVGRFPAQTPAQLAVMVDKTLGYDQGDSAAPWRRRAFVVADNKEPDFAAEAGAFAQALPGFTSEVVTIEGDGETARSALQRAWAEGTGLVGYFGHGSLTLWAQQKIFSVEDVAKLTNGEKLPIVFTLTCLSGFFQHPTTVSLGESLLRSQNGAVAALVPSGAGLLEDQRLMARGLAEALSKPVVAAPTLGETVRTAQLSLPQLTDGTRETLLTFNLLGDPALPITK